MDRPIWRDQQQSRTFDYLSLAREFLRDFGFAFMDLLGSSGALASGLSATATSPESLVVNLAAGRIYQWAMVDATQYGDLGQDTSNTMQQGIVAAQSLTFSTSGLSSGQSRYALVQAEFTQIDVIPSDDPNGGVLPYYNVNNENNPLSGPGNTGASQATRRTGVCTVSIKYGGVATTGSEVAPSPDTGYVGLYLVDLAYGQTQVTAAQIAMASGAPFLAGLLNSHHSGATGRAPKVILDNGLEVQGVLPNANAPVPSNYLDQIGASRGSILYRGATGWAVLAPGSANQILQSGGAGANPSWGTQVERWTSAPFSPTGGAHNQATTLTGLTGQIIISVTLSCISAEQGWAVGDILPSVNISNQGFSGARGYVVGLDGSNRNMVCVCDSNSIIIEQKTGGAATLDATKWNMQVTIKREF